MAGPWFTVLESGEPWSDLGTLRVSTGGATTTAAVVQMRLTLSPVLHAPPEVAHAR